MAEADAARAARDDAQLKRATDAMLRKVREPSQRDFISQALELEREFRERGGTR
jgi:hypothetical protein